MIWHFAREKPRQTPMDDQRSPSVSSIRPLHFYFKRDINELSRLRLISEWFSQSDMIGKSRCQP